MKKSKKHWHIRMSQTHISIKHIHATLLLVFGIGAEAALANEEVNVRINGFASFVGGITAKKNDHVLEYGNNLSFNEDSIFGLQTSADIENNITLVSQFVSRGVDDFETKIEWAYASYRVGQKTSIRVGKLRAPFYEYSESLEIGYSYHWIRPPIETYFLPLTSVSGGVGVVHEWSTENMSGDLNMTYGTADQELKIPESSLSGDPERLFSVDLNDLYIISGSLSWNSLRFRASYGRARELTASNDETELLSAVFPEEVSRDVLMSEKPADFMGFCAFFEKDYLFFGMEYTVLDWARNVLISDQDAFYLTGGIKKENSTFHLTYSKVDSKTEKFSYPAPIPSTSNPWEQSSWTAGWRYDITNNSAIKVEYAAFSDDHQKGLPGHPVNRSGSRYDEEPKLLSFALDFVF